MPGTRRTRARIEGARRAREVADRAGTEIRLSRRRRRMTQAALAAKVGISRAHLSKIEAGGVAGLPAELWFALGEALGRPFRAEFVVDRLREPADAPHLAIQELVLRLAGRAGYEGRFELPTRPADPSRSCDALLLDRRGRRLIVAECWNSFGDLGAAARSSNRKLAEAAALAVSVGGDDQRFAIALCWVVRDTARNRELLARYPHIFESRFPGSSLAWTRALTHGEPPPAEPGFVWCDARATRLFARRDAMRRAAGL